MAVAALYDIHGNLPALEAVLGEIRREHVERIVVGGDVFPGPMATEALDLLLALDVPVFFLLGNGDREALATARGAEPVAVLERYRPSIRWNAERLEAKHRSAIASWPATVSTEVLGLGRVLFCHATPDSDTAIVTRRTSDEKMRATFDGRQASLVVCGHTHMPFDITAGSTRVVNPGSIGMPFGEAGAHWLLLGPDVRFRRTVYDLEAAAARVRETAYPDAHEFAATNILSPPTEEAMLDLFARA